MTATAWYLVLSKLQQEERALWNLERQGFTAFLPRMRVSVRRGGRFRQRVEPMFPRYLFVHFDADTQPSTPIRSTYGVSTLVRFGYRPASVPNDLIDGLRAHVDASGVVVDHTPPALEKGQHVRVIDGLLQGYEGIVEARTGGERVRILLDVANRHTVAELSAHEVMQTT
ncbi:MAG: transcription/translation regulatory transformer protein RfaH [Proteobacteria bacterium SW_6_67_9]|nr:MAG: transcription/translation regulatory transformer protein RfaH [Proteobacteria bacterium SW_6_67_9]